MKFRPGNNIKNRQLTPYQPPHHQKEEEEKMGTVVLQPVVNSLKRAVLFTIGRKNYWRNTIDRHTSLNI